MSDQQTSPETETPTAAVDSPAEGIDPQQTQDTPQQDWERDYKELQREFTRTRQQMTDPEYQAKVAQEWLSEQGYALPEDEPEQFDDPTQALAARLDAFEAQLTEREQAEQRQQQIADLEATTEAKLAKIDGLDEGDKNWIVSRAIVLPPHEDGSLDVDQAYQELVARDQARMKQWRDTKRAPHISPNGQAATGVKNLDDMSLEELTKWQAQRFADLSAD